MQKKIELRFVREDSRRNSGLLVWERWAKVLDCREVVGGWLGEEAGWLEGWLGRGWFSGVQGCCTFGCCDVVEGD
jgi:hypothetical protein